MNRFLALCSLLLILATPGQATLSLPSIFGDHMVLQQDLPLPVWGKAAPGEKVFVSIAGQEKEATADADGRWQLHIDPLPSNREPTEMQVKSGDTTLIFRDVLIGDVWLCSGQSNMAMGIAAMEGAQELIAGAHHPELRLFHVGRNVSFFEDDDLLGEWVVCTPETILQGGGRGFSGLAYLFGREIQQAQNIPVGLIASSVGGTRIQAWSSIESLEPLKELLSTQRGLRNFLQTRDKLDSLLETYQGEILPAWQHEHDKWSTAHRAALEEWRRQREIARESNAPLPSRPDPAPAPRRPQSPDANFGHPSVLFNGMIRPLIPYGIRGVIWYQGEANAYPTLADEYEELLTRMIADWRSRWGQGDFPFLFVQLPNLANAKPEWATIRDAQRKALTLPATAMAVAIDAGDPDDLHPQNKQTIADRLVLSARKVAYGEEIVHSGPLVKDMEVEGGKIHLSFTHMGSGFEDREAILGFEIAGADGVFQPADARIVEDTVVVWNEEVPAPESIRYAWAPDPPATLYNREGLPASPFLLPH